MACTALPVFVMRRDLLGCGVAEAGLLEEYGVDAEGKSFLEDV